MTASPYRVPYVAGEPAEWIKQIANGRSGVYYIRNRQTRQLLYIGESHTGRLRKTLLRHFQLWSGFTAGKRYSKTAVEVRVKFMPPAAAKPHQDSEILRLNPRDNEYPQHDNNEPF